jgi:hypothetical protein
MPTEMGSEGVEEALGRARSALRDEADRTRAGFHQVEDPGVQYMGNIKGGLDRLKDKFTFLHEYSDEFIKSTGSGCSHKGRIYSKEDDGDGQVQEGRGQAGAE